MQLQAIQSVKTPYPLRAHWLTASQEPRGLVSETNCVLSRQSGFQGTTLSERVLRARQGERGSPSEGSMWLSLCVRACGAAARMVWCGGVGCGGVGGQCSRHREACACCRLRELVAQVSPAERAVSYTHLTLPTKA